MRKYLEKRGYKVTYARNYTDVDDKIIARAKETGIPADVYAAEMIKKIDKVMAEFDVDDPTLWLKATENINSIIDFISRLIESGHAYPAKNGDVYFSVSSFKRYGCLSNRSVEDMLDGVRRRKRRKQARARRFRPLERRERGRDLLGIPLGARADPAGT